MTQNDMDSGLRDQGAEGGQPSTSPAGGQPGSIGSDTSQWVSRKEFNELAALARRLQSDEDRAKSRIEKRQDDLEARLIDRYDQYRTEGLTPAAARRQMRIDALLEAQSEKTQAVGTQHGGGTPQADVPDVKPEQALQVLGLDANDPEVTRLLREGQATPVNLMRLAMTRRGQQPSAPVQPAPQSQMPMYTGQSGGVDLETQYQKEIAKVRRGDAKGRMDLRIKYRQLARQQGAKSGPWD